MNVDRFSATADIIGRRVKISWDVALAEGEGLDKAPRLVLRRKERDFEFPAVTGVDTFVVYDSGALPPGTTVTEVDLGETRTDGMRTSTLARSISRRTGDVSVEVLRHTRTITYDQQRRPVRYRDEIIDVHDSATGLTPGTTYYYQLSRVPAFEAAQQAAFRAVATPTEALRSGRMMYELLPAIIRRHDVSKAPTRQTGSIPEAAPDSGQLQRFVDVFGTGLDHLRSRADGLRRLHEVDTVDHRMLEHLATWLGWDLGHDKSIPIQRHEIKYAAHLYRITGTLPGCAIWVRRLTGWDARVKELWRNVLFTNDVGNPNDPTDNGSHTLDTRPGNRPQLDAMWTIGDTADYVCDMRTGPGLHYAMNTIAIVVRRLPGETDADVERKSARIVNGSGLFAPFNLRAVVLDADAVIKH
jgi:phage tail-like protein